MNAASEHDRGELIARRGLLVVVAAAAVTAVLAGLARLGVSIAWGPSRAMDHGPLFVLGVFGTVIALERTVALGRGWAFTAPVLGAIAAVAMTARLPGAAWIATSSSVALCVVNGAIVRRQAAAFTWLMMLGSIVLVVGNVQWAMGSAVPDVVSSWMTFFVLTIVAERLELSRLAPTPRWASRALVLLALAIAIAAGARALGFARATHVLGGAVAALAAWQLRYDLARRTWKQPGLPRFAASGVLLGAAWLLLAGVLLATRDLPPAGPLYDAALHGVFVGYVLSMVFAHAPIILPAVARVQVPFSPGLYAPLALLHVGLALRVTGDLAGVVELRRAGGVATAIALILFALTVVIARARRSK